MPEPGKLYGKINWRIAKPDQDFIERSTVQTFQQVRAYTDDNVLQCRHV